MNSAPEQSNSMNSRNCWSGPCWRKFDKSCVGKVPGLIFSQNYRNYPIYGTMETMFIEGFHWNMHGICLATLLLTMQFHNQCQAYYSSVLQQHECGTWRKLLIKVAMWPQTQVVQPNFETEDFSNSMRSGTGTGRFAKAMVSSRQGWHRCFRRQCQDLSVNCHILDSNFWKLHFDILLLILKNPRKWWIVSLKPEDWPVDRFGRWGPPRGLEVSAKHLCRGNPVTPKQCGRWLLRVDGVRFGPCKILNFYSGFLGPGSSFPFGYKFKLMASGYAFVLAGSWTWSLASGLCLLAFLLSKRAARNLVIIELYWLQAIFRPNFK